MQPTTDTTATATTPNLDWRKPDGKRERIKEVWGDTVPDYLYFALPDNVFEKTTEEEDDAIGHMFFGEDVKPNPGDIIPIWNTSLEGVKIWLRIRNARVLQTEVTLGGGQTCPLIQVGHAEYSPDELIWFPPEPTMSKVHVIQITVVELNHGSTPTRRPSLWRGFTGAVSGFFRGLFGDKN